MKYAFAVISTALVVVALSCNPSHEPGDTVIATDRLGPITASEVDRFVLNDPTARQLYTGLPADERTTAIVRRLAVRRLLLDQARQLEDDAELEKITRRVRREAYSRHYIASLEDTAEPLTDDTLREHYETHREQFDRPERRSVLHIYQRFPADGERQRVLERMDALRERVQRGESFALLAREHSESETRHQDGRLGYVARGSISPAFDEIVFSLAKNRPSEVVTTADGAHMFLVESVLEANTLSFAQARPVIANELNRERQHRQLADVAAGLPSPAPRHELSPSELVAALGDASPEAVLLRLGSFELRLDDLVEEVSHRRRELGPRATEDLPVRVYEEIRDREIIYQHVLSTGLPDIDASDLSTERDRQVVEHLLARNMAEMVSEQPERVRRFWESNRMRFTTPLRLQLTSLEVPLGESPTDRMTRLEAARAKLDAGSTTVEHLASELGGAHRSTSLAPLAQLLAHDPRALQLVAPLQPGEHTPPFRRGNVLVVLRVDVRSEPSPLPLSEVREQVEREYLSSHSAEIYEEYTDDLLDAAGFTLYSERLETITLVGAPSQPSE